jgi:hypothetical protein
MAQHVDARRQRVDADREPEVAFDGALPATMPRREQHGGVEAGTREARRFAQVVAVETEQNRPQRPDLVRMDEVLEHLARGRAVEREVVATARESSERGMSA